MIMPYKSVALCILFKLLPNCLIAQQAITSSGRIIGNPTGSIHWVIGQINYESASPTNTLSRGVLQVYSYLSVSETLQIKVGPNPVNDLLTLHIQGNLIANLSYQLVDLFGQEIENKPILNIDTIIQMKEYRTGMYLLLIHCAQQQPIALKIIKL